jgi:poly(3-hydroxybutyrate) depolymerase
VSLTRRRVLAGAAGCALAVAVPGRAAATVPPLTGAHRLLPGGRLYWLSGAGDRLVIGLPGTGLTADNCNRTFDNVIGWQGHADAAGYTLALAELLAGGWNVGGGWPGGSQDDMAYLLALVADADVHSGPFVEVFVAGFSAGGAMAWRAAAERPDVFAAAGSCSGWAPLYPGVPIDAWHAHGTGDTTVPVRGGVGTGGFVFPPAASEAARAPRGSRVELYPTSGGHGTPGWAAGALWQFWTVDRARP